MRITAILAGLLWLASGLHAQEKTALPADLALVPAKAVGMVTVRVADLWAGEIGKAVRAKEGKNATTLAPVTALLGVPLAEIERVSLVLADASGTGNPALFVTTTKPQERKKLLERLAPGWPEKKHAGKAYHVQSPNQAVAVLSERVHVMGSEAQIKALLGRGKEAREGGLTPALAAAGKHAVVVGVNPAELPRLDNAPMELAFLADLLKAKSAWLTVDLGKSMGVELHGDFASSKEAAAGLKALASARKLGQNMLGGVIRQMSSDKESAGTVALLRALNEGLGSATLGVKNSAVVALASAKIEQQALAGELLEAATKARQAAARMQSVNNLKQIALAMHVYHDKFGTFPPAAVYDKNGKALLSWRVLLLPYLDANDLYEKFKLDEAWDGPNNKKLLAKMPKIFASPVGQPKADQTFYQVLVGKGAAFEGKAGVKITDFTDGTSNTILAVEAGTAVPWTKPADLGYQKGKQLPALGKLFAGGFNAAFADGSVRFVSKSVKAKTLEALITRNGGEVLGSDDK